MSNQESAYCLAWIHGERGTFEWERQPFEVMSDLFVHEHTVPHGCAVGFPGGRNVSTVPLGLSAVRRSGVAVIAACREQVEEDPETRSGDALTSRHIGSRCVA